MTLQDNDQFLVDRDNTPYSVDSQTLVAKLQDSDLMVVCRSGVPYKATGAEIKDSLGSPAINPGLNDITLDPSTPGSGTEVDPYILQTQVVAPYGSTTQSVETITIIGQPPQAQVVWRDSSVDAGSRFAQVSGELTDANGVWTGQLEYADIPDSTEETTYVGKLSIGLVYFQWTITQRAVAVSPTSVTSVTLIEATPAESNRFTSESFVASSEVVDGFPVSTKTIDAHVDGTLSKLVQFDEPLESSGTTTTPNQNGSVLTTQVASGQNLGDFFSEFGRTILDTRNYGTTPTGIRCTLATPIENVETMHLVWGSASLQTQYWAHWVRVGAADQWIQCTSPWAEPDRTQQKIDWSSAFDVSSQIPSNGIVTEFEFGLSRVDGTTAAGSQQSWGGLVINGETVISSQTLGTLIFANGTNMEALAGGDTVNQTSNFTEPLESSGTTTGPVYSDYLTTSGGFNPIYPATNTFADPPDAAFTRTNSNRALVDFSPPSPLSGTFESYTIENAEIVVYHDGGETRHTTTGTVYLFPETFTNITKITVQRQENFLTQILWFKINGEYLIDGTVSTELTFANGTDMSELEAGDAVSQSATQIAAQTWSNGISGSGNGVVDAVNAFDGDTGTQARSVDDDGRITWALTGAVFDFQKLKIRVDSANTDYAFYLNSALYFSKDSDSNGDFEVDISAYGAGNFTSVGIACTEGLQTGVRTFSINDVIVIDNQAIDVVNQTSASGTVSSITGTTATLSSSSGAWTNGEDVTTGNKTTTGTVSGVSDTTATLSSSSGSWLNGLKVIGPQKTIVEENTRLYCAFDSNGNITDLQNNPQDPPYTTQDSNPGLTFTFPATFPSGQAPDDELPDGTTFTVEVSAENSTSSSGPVSATVQPEPATPDAPLAGLTTLYTGDNAGKTITNGIDNLNNGGLAWIKNRDNIRRHVLFDTLRPTNGVLSSNLTDAQQLLTGDNITWNSDGFSLTGGDGDFNSTSFGNYVAWNFGVAPGYFDVVTYTGDGVSGKAISHSLGSAPGFIIIKNLDETNAWNCWHSGITSPNSNWWQNYVLLNSANAASEWTTALTSEPTSTSFTVGTGGAVNNSGINYVAYLFAEDTPDVIKCGSLNGPGTAVVGFEPQWLLLKSTDANSNWRIFDNKRGTAGNMGELKPDSADAEVTRDVTFTSNGFSTSLDYNKIYVAIAAPPAVRSQTPAEFAESQAKFLTYNNRAEIETGKEAEAKRQQIFNEIQNLGIDTSEVRRLLGK